MVETCAYCGEPATDREHVIPRVYLRMVADVGGPRTTEIVPACRECNALAGASVFGSFEEKRAYIRGRIEERYRRLLTLPRWKEEEIAELGPSLRSHIERQSARRERVRERLRYMGRPPRRHPAAEPVRAYGEMRGEPERERPAPPTFDQRGLGRGHGDLLVALARGGRFSSSAAIGARLPEGTHWQTREPLSVGRRLRTLWRLGYVEHFAEGWRLTPSGQDAAEALHALQPAISQGDAA